MSALIEAVRVHVAGRPLLMAVALALLLAALLRGRRADRVAVAATAAIGGAALAVYAAIAAWYASVPQFFDPAEPTMPIVGWLFTLGQPIYHDVDAASRYAHVYGPLAFIAHGLVLLAFGPGIAVSKWLGAAAGLGSLALTFATLRTATTRTRALALTGACALVYLAFRNYTFWTRPDPLQLLAVAGALLAIARTRGVLAGALLGVAAGLLAGLKFTGPLYTLPLLVLLVRRDGWPAGAIAVGVGASAALAPFALPNVSLWAFLAWVELSAGNGIRAAALRQNLDWAAFVLIPWIVTVMAARREPRPTTDWPLAAALGIGLAGVIIAAAKPGAGPYHLLPFVPVIAFGISRAIGEGRPFPDHRLAAPAIVAWLATAAIAAGAQQASFFASLAESRSRDEAGDVAAFLDREPALVVQMADSRYDRPTYARPVLTFRSGLYLIDTPAVQEHQLAGIPVPAATIDAIRRCRAGAWLVPAGTEPFAGVNRYPSMAMAPLYPDALRAAFRETYARAGRTAYFDVWRCRTTPAR
jgi:hypothetical protein